MGGVGVPRRVIGGKVGEGSRVSLGRLGEGHAWELREIAVLGKGKTESDLRSVRRKGSRIGIEGVGSRG